MSDEAINYINSNGSTALSLAINKGFEKLCEMLIPRMSNETINRFYSNCDTALILAANKGLEKIYKILLFKMSNEAINRANIYGVTAQTIAKNKGFKDIVDLLQKISNKNILTDNISIEKKYENQQEQIFSENVNLQKLTDELNNKIADNITINNRDKAIMIDTVKVISQKLKFIISKIDKKEIATSLEELINNKPTKVKIMIIEERIDELMEQQNTIVDQLVSIFQESVNKVGFKIANDNIINNRDKAIMKDALENIIEKAKELNDIVDVEKINVNIKKLIIDKPTKVKIMKIEEQIEELIAQQNINDDVSVLGSDNMFG